MLAELRHYTITPGKTEELLAQFRDLSLPLFDRHGIGVHGPWLRDLTKGRQLVYILEFADEADRERRWTAFRNDPDWVAAQRANAGQVPFVAGSETIELTR